MFKLFGKKEIKETEVIVAEIPQSKYPQVVHDIHNEFYTAGDSILQEAESLLKELEVKDLAKGKRLAALGFGKTREAVVAIETENKLATTKEIADLVMYYRINYPNNKFITEEQVKQICEKYGLVCGDTTMYKGFVPENKLQIIEKFKLHSIDSDLVQLINTCVLNIPIGVYSLKKLGIKNNDYSYLIAGGKLEGRVDMEVELKQKAISLGVREDCIYIERADNAIGLKICAPLKDMEIPDTKHLVGYKIEDKPIPDPVVLQPVNGGYLIVCAWGDEASDEIVVNQNNN